MDEVESDEEELAEDTPISPPMENKLKREEPTLMRMKISCWNMNAKMYRKKLPLELGGKKEAEIFENCGIEGILMVNKERTSALAKDLQGALSLAEFALYR